MTVKIRYFAAARELAGCSEEVLSEPIGSTDALRRVLAERHSALAVHLPRMRLAVNGEFVDAVQPLKSGDEVDVLPPVAGGNDGVWVAICDSALSVDELIARVTHPRAGGIAIFLGIVRDNAHGKSVGRLDYEAHPTLARAEMERVLVGIAREHSEVRLAAAHRIGSLSISDIAVAVAASAPHRAEAFQACRLAIDRIKETVPIWKHEWDADGIAHWVNL